MDFILFNFVLLRDFFYSYLKFTSKIMVILRNWLSCAIFFFLNIKIELFDMNIYYSLGIHKYCYYIKSHLNSRKLNDLLCKTVGVDYKRRK